MVPDMQVAVETVAAETGTVAPGRVWLVRPFRQLKCAPTRVCWAYASTCTVRVLRKMWCLCDAVEWLRSMSCQS